MDEWGGLENRCGLRATVGSNPTLSAERIAQFLLGDFVFNRYPSLYILISSCQGILGHREGDFDFRYHLSHLFPYVNNIHFCSMISDPVVSPGVGFQSIH